MYLSPNFKVNNDDNTALITPQVGSDDKVDKFMIAEKIGTGGTITLSEDVDMDRVVLATLDNLKTMYLYSNGEIKIER